MRTNLIQRSKTAAASLPGPRPICIRHFLGHLPAGPPALPGPCRRVLAGEDRAAAGARPAACWRFHCVHFSTLLLWLLPVPTGLGSCLP